MGSYTHMIVGKRYKVTEAVYDDYNEGLQPETDVVEVISKTKNSVILKNIEHNFSYERTYQHLLTCNIEEINTK